MNTKLLYHNSYGKAVFLYVFMKSAQRGRFSARQDGKMFRSFANTLRKRQNIVS